MKVLVTGGCGFLGCNLTAEMIQKKFEITLIDNLSRKGSDSNLNWLKTLGNFRFEKTDIRDRLTIDRLIKELRPDVIFHLAGQVAMTTSLADPRSDFEINVGGGINILEAVRNYSPHSILTYSSTNKVYGDMEQFQYTEAKSRYTCKEHPEGFDETVTLNFHSPYGCSKGATDQYMLDYARLFGLKTIVFRHSSIFGGRQFSTYDQGWVGWFIQQALLTQKGELKDPFTISGNGKQVRDVLFSTDLNRCYFSAIENISKTQGQAFNIGGGIQNSLSLLELFSFLESELSVKLKYKQLDWRASDQKVFVADTLKAKSLMGWQPMTDKETGLRKMIEWVKSQ